MIYNNYHTHTHFCDGSSEPEKYIESALESGLSSLGFSGHAPVPFENKWSIKQERINEYIDTINLLKHSYADRLNVFLALEIDYIPGITSPMKKLKQDYGLDYTIGSVHLVTDKMSDKLWFIDGPDKNYISGLEEIFNNDIERAVTYYYKQLQEMVLTQKPDIIGHLDKIKMNNKGRFFSVDEKWYKALVRETINIIASSESIVEVNTRGIYKKRSDSLFPDEVILGQCYKLGIPVTVSSDAHSPDELINYYDETIDILKNIGFKGIQVFKDNKWQLQSF